MRDFRQRVDDAILSTAQQLSQLRGSTIRGAIVDFRQTAIEMSGIDEDNIWRVRRDRCEYFSTLEDDELRRMAKDAVERERT